MTHLVPSGRAEQQRLKGLKQTASHIVFKAGADDFTGAYVSLFKD